jgi:hypothetical protein
MIAAIDIVPNYFNGFTFKWTVEPDFTGPRPWQFIVQESKNDSTWNDISAVIEDAFIYQEHKRRLYPRTDVVKFRIKSMSDGKEYVSFTVAPYAEMNKREFLLAREIMRKEILIMKRSSGVGIKLYKYDYFAKTPSEGIDPVSGSVVDPDYRVPGVYYGPYDLYGAFEPQEKEIKQEDDGRGYSEQFFFKVRTIGFPYINPYDILFDDTEDRAFHVEKVKNVAEIRRFAIVQELNVRELPKSDATYRLRDCI